MSYSSVAARGPEQTVEEKCAPIPQEIENQEPVTQVLSVDVDTNSVHTVPAEFKSQTIPTENLENRVVDKHDSEEKYNQVKQEGSEKFSESQEKKATTQKKENISHVNSKARDYVSLFNTIAAVAMCSGLSFGGYRKYIAGELNWKLVGVWTGIVGAFAITNFNLSRIYRFFISQSEE